MKKKIGIVLGLLFFVSFSWRWQWWRKDEPGISIFMYHRIGYPVKDTRNKGLWVGPKRFKSQLEYLKKNRYTCITFKQLASIWDAQDFPEKTVILTFDDGYQDLYENALPILQEYGFPAVVFPIVGYLGNEFPSRKKGRREYKILSIEKIKEMKKSGIQFGSHSLRHLHLSQLKEQEKQIEIFESRRILEEILTEPVIVYCYPYGEFDQSVENLVEEAGYKFACTTRKGKNMPGQDRFRLKRMSMAHKNLLEFILLLKKGRIR